MKGLILIASLLFTIGAMANEACDKFIACGTFQGIGTNYHADGTAFGGSFREKQVVTAHGKWAVDLEEYIVFDPNKDFGDPGTYVLKVRLEFDKTGLFKLANNKVGIAGYCSDQVCNIAFKPNINTEKQRQGITNIIRLDGDVLTRDMSVSVANEAPGYQRSTLTKQ